MFILINAPHVGDADRRLLLLYLANDVLQNGKRKGADVFMELFQEPLKESMQIIRYLHSKQYVVLLELVCTELCNICHTGKVP